MAKALPLPTEYLCLQFEHATVQFKITPNAPATGKTHYELSVMAIDQYRYQRELSVRLGHLPGNSDSYEWTFCIYRHPGHRREGMLTSAVAVKFIQRFLELCEKYPSLLFNKTGEHERDKTRPRHEGFVHFAEALHAGAEFSVGTLNAHT